MKSLERFDNGEETGEYRAPETETEKDFGKKIESEKNIWDVSDIPDRYIPGLARCGFLPRTGGEWTGEPGNSKWRPDRSIEPGDRNGTNPEHRTWDEIMKKYEIDSIPFCDGEPDFSQIAKGQVEIDDFTDDRSSNFDQADEELAKQWGCTPEEIAKWREENRYTWHECMDCRTMQLVPTEVHGNISHTGGISVYKLQNKQF